MNTASRFAAHRRRLACSSLCALGWALAVPALAGPDTSLIPAGVPVSSQTRTIGGSPVDFTVIDVRGRGARAILPYPNFDVGSAEGVEFLQASAQAQVLNRILGSAPTRIDGRVIANGQVFVVNPAGVVFGRSAVVNVGALFAAAGTLRDEDFLAGRLDFLNLTGSVENAGTIRTNPDSPAPAVALLGKTVANAGQIAAPNGAIVLVAGRDVFLTREGSHVLVRIEGVADGVDPGSPGIANSGSLEAPGGSATLAVGDLYDTAIRQSESASVRAREIALRGPGAVEAGGSFETAGGGAGSISIETQGNLRIGSLAAVGGDVTLLASGIEDASPGEQANVRAATARLEAGLIGIPDDIDVAVSQRLTAFGVGINIDSAGVLPVGEMSASGVTLRGASIVDGSPGDARLNIQADSVSLTATSGSIGGPRGDADLDVAALALSAHAADSIDVDSGEFSLPISSVSGRRVSLRAAEINDSSAPAPSITAERLDLTATGLAGEDGVGGLIGLNVAVRDHLSAHASQSIQLSSPGLLPLDVLSAPSVSLRAAAITDASPGESPNVSADSASLQASGSATQMGMIGGSGSADLDVDVTGQLSASARLAIEIDSPHALPLGAVVAPAVMLQAASILDASEDVDASADEAPNLVASMAFLRARTGSIGRPGTGDLDVAIRGLLIPEAAAGRYIEFHPVPSGADALPPVRRRDPRGR